MPVFAGDGSGAATFASVESGRLVLGATGGYLIGFLAASAAVGALAERGWDRRLRGSIAAMLMGTLIVYTVGLAWLALALDRSVTDVLPFGLYPFVPGDILKLLLAAGLSSSRTEANRMLSQGAVSVDGEKLAAGQLELEAHAGDQLLFKVGKRRFARVTID